MSRKSEIERMVSEEGIAPGDDVDIPEDIEDMMKDAGALLSAGLDPCGLDEMAQAEIIEKQAEKKTKQKSSGSKIRHETLAQSVYHKYKDEPFIGPILFQLMNMYDLTPADPWFKTLQHETPHIQRNMLIIGISGLEMGIRIAEAHSIRTQKDELQSLVNSLRVEHMHLAALKESEVTRQAQIKAELDDQSKHMRSLLEKFENMIIKTSAPNKISQPVVPSAPTKTVVKTNPIGILHFRVNEVTIDLDFNQPIPEMKFKGKKTTSSTLLKLIKALMLKLNDQGKNAFHGRTLIIPENKINLIKQLNSPIGLTAYYEHEPIKPGPSTKTD